MSHGSQDTRPRVAVLVDYENVYFSDRAAYSDPEAVRRLARDLTTVAEHCGPVSMRKAFAPFPNHPAAMRVFTEEGYDAVTCDEKPNAADLKLIAALTAVTSEQDIGLVILVSGDGDMLEAIETAQRRGARVVVVSCGGRELSARTKAAADRVLVLREVAAEAKRIRNGKRTKLGLGGLAFRGAGGGTPAVPESPAARAGSGPAGRSPAEAAVHAGPSLPGVRSTTPSALKTYVNCPRRYFYRYVQRRPESMKPHLFVGNVVHEALKTFFEMEPHRRSAKDLEERLRDAWRRSPDRAAAFPPDMREAEAAAGKAALEDLRLFVRRADLRAVPFALEEFLMTEVGDGVVVRGKIDRIDPSPKGDALVVIDYKTGRPPDTPPNLVDEFQLPLYCAMVEEGHARPVERVRLLYLKGHVTYDFSPREVDIARAKRRALRLFEEIEADTEFRPKVSPLCGHCDFLPDCPAREEAEALLARKTEGREAGEGVAGTADDLPF